MYGNRLPTGHQRIHRNAGQVFPVRAERCNHQRTCTLGTVPLVDLLGVFQGPFEYPVERWNRDGHRILSAARGYAPPLVSWLCRA